MPACFLAEPETPLAFVAPDCVGMTIGPKSVIITTRHHPNQGKQICTNI